MIAHDQLRIREQVLSKQIKMCYSQYIYTINIQIYRSPIHPSPNKQNIYQLCSKRSIPPWRVILKETGYTIHCSKGINMNPPVHCCIRCPNWYQYQLVNEKTFNELLKELQYQQQGIYYFIFNKYYVYSETNWDGWYKMFLNICKNN